MSNYLHTRIRDLGDADLRALLAELCHCVRWDLSRHEGDTVFQFLSSLFLEHPDGVTLDHLPVPGWLGTKTHKLKASSPVRDFCGELIYLKRTHIEFFDKKPVLALITECFPSQSPARGGRELSERERETRLIIQRRRNGDL